MLDEYTKDSDPMPRKVRPMLATLVDKPFDSKDWIFEIKWDGYRAIAEVAKYGVNFYSRNQVSFNETFPPLLESLADLEEEAVLDGEVVVVDQKGIGKFQLLQQYQKTKKGILVYYLFDILFLNGKDLQNLPLSERKTILKKAFPLLPANIKISDFIEEEGINFYKLALKEGLEGIIAKKSNSIYRQGQRSRDWLKIKTHLRQEAIIAGFTEPKGGRKYFGSLVLGVFVKGKLQYIGHSGGSFDENNLKDLYEKLKALEIKGSPFADPPKTNAQYHWVKPILICETAFSEWTNEGIMRQPIFLGLREDKSPLDVHIEKTTAPPSSSDFRDLKITDLNKIYFPEDKFSKGDVIEYYKKISDIILPYLKDRPQSLYRMPEGIYQKHFYQKDIYPKVVGIKTFPIYRESEDKMKNYIIGDDEKTLLYIINLGCIELNPWFSRIQNLDKPDYMVLDLDPLEIDFSAVLKTAKVIKEILDQANVNSYVKTSGKTGLHVYIPLGAQYPYDEVKEFGEIIAKIVQKQLPDITSVERMPKKRKGKVYIDYLQNRKGQTITAPYSLRPVKGLRVSAPLLWEEIDKQIDPAEFTVKNIFQRIEKFGDFFKPVLYEKIDLLKVLDKLSKMI